MRAHAIWSLAHCNNCHSDDTSCHIQPDNIIKQQPLILLTGSKLYAIAASYINQAVLGFTN